MIRSAPLHEAPPRYDLPEPEPAFRAAEDLARDARGQADRALDRWKHRHGRKRGHTIDLADRTAAFAAIRASVTTQTGKATTVPIGCDRCGEVYPERPARFDCACEVEAYRSEYDAVHADRWPSTAVEVWADAGIPRRHRDASFASFQPRPGTGKALELCQRYADAFSPATTAGLWLIGTFGAGKTHLAVATARAASERTLAGVRFTTAADLVASVRPAAGQRDWHWEAVDESVSADLLILDDLGQEQSTDFNRDVLYRVLHGRYEASRPLIVTSNGGDAQLKERLGGAAVSRLYEMTRAAVLKATDYRAELAKTA